ncbi:hypothetical protein H6H03_20645 [Nostoc paludosum FACHB-159]|uniref:Uncharacterized protein n=1 Tax=Nostoc paludosum FACHB-159 TaxID=2692908 RepID=A0ABR8KBQ0_9NOSO|nr:hypothetical protein [Nostoc paludosum FACHB-159]
MGKGKGVRGKIKFIPLTFTPASSAPLPPVPSPQSPIPNPQSPIPNPQSPMPNNNI